MRLAPPACHTKTTKWPWLCLDDTHLCRVCPHQMACRPAAISLCRAQLKKAPHVPPSAIDPEKTACSSTAIWPSHIFPLRLEILVWDGYGDAVSPWMLIFAELPMLVLWIWPRSMSAIDHPCAAPESSTSLPVNISRYAFPGNGSATSNTT